MKNNKYGAEYMDNDKVWDNLNLLGEENPNAFVLKIKINDIGKILGNEGKTLL